MIALGISDIRTWVQDSAYLEPFIPPSWFTGVMPGVCKSLRINDSSFPKYRLFILIWLGTGFFLSLYMLLVYEGAKLRYRKSW